MSNRAKKQLILHIPYVIMGLIATNLGEAWRLAEGANSSEKLLSFMNGEDATWFGQLMARPQLYAWLIQMEYWMESYRVSFV